MTALKFLQDYYKCYDDNFGVNYRPYKYGCLVKTISLREAVEMLEKDIAHLREFLSEYGIEEKAAEETFAYWKEHHLVKF